MAFGVGLSTAVNRYCKVEVGLPVRRGNSCICVNFHTMEADPNCHLCFATGMRPDEEYGVKGVIATYHRFKSPLRHLKPFMSEADQQVYRRACEVRHRFLEKVTMAGPSYRVSDGGWQLPFEPETYDPAGWDS